MSSTDEQANAVAAIQAQATAAIAAVQLQAQAVLAAVPVTDAAPTTAAGDGGGGGGATTASRMRARAVSVGVVTFLLGALFASLTATDSGDQTAAAGFPAATASGGGVAPGGATGAIVPGGSGAPGATLGTGGAAPATGGVSAPGGGSGPPAPGAGTPGPAGGASTPGAPAAPTGGATDGGTGDGGAAPVPVAAPTGPVRGVTDTTVKIGIYAGDYSALGAACPRCATGPPKAPPEALVAAWRRDGLLPVHGRDLELIQIEFNGLSAEEQRSTCVQFTQEVKPFIIVPETALAECPAREFGYLTLQSQIGGMDEANMPQAYPNYFVAGPTMERVYRNKAVWAHTDGLLTDQVLGMFSPSDALMQGQIDRSLRPTLKELGYELAVDFVSEGQQDEAVAVQRMRGEGVTTVLIPNGTIGTPIGFQSAARNQGYMPRYLTQEATYEMNDAVADTAWDIESMHGQVGMKTREWDWSVRKPATAEDNPAANYCLRAVEEYTGEEIDIFDNSSQVEASLMRCSSLGIIREAMVRAGPGLTEASFVAAVESIQGMQVASFHSVSFGPGLRHSGTDLFATATFDKNRHAPQNTYWKRTEPWRSFWLD